MANQADLPVRTMCRVLGVSASGFYAWLDRSPSQRSIANAVMTERIRQVHKDSYESYGMPRVRAELMEQGACISRQRVARLMRSARLQGISKRRGFTVTTHRDKRQASARDLVNRRFRANGPNQLWVADMTYVPTWMGFLYLAVVIDVHEGHGLQEGVPLRYAQLVKVRKKGRHVPSLFFMLLLDGRVSGTYQQKPGRSRSRLSSGRSGTVAMAWLQYWPFFSTAGCESVLAVLSSMWK